MEVCCDNCDYKHLNIDGHPCNTCICYNNWMYENWKCDELNDKVPDTNANPENDPVNHPSHYCQGDIECIDAMEAAFGKEAVANFCACNAFKYIFRFQNKNGLEDVKKAMWYLDKYIELVRDTL